MTGDTPEIEQWVLLARYAAGECSPVERGRVERWLAVDPTRRAVLEELRIAAVDAVQLAEPPDAAAERTADDVAWHKLVTAIGTRRPAAAVGHAAGADSDHRIAARAVGRRPGSWPGRVGLGDTRPAVWRAAKMAAAIVVVAGGALAAWRTGWVVPAQQFREFASAPGSRTTITLVDGTQLVLGPATHLRVPGNFGATTTRAVELDGQAVFTVVHDARHPFEVRTNRTTVRDVGTTFAVRAYAGDPDERVAVAEGEVALLGISLRERDVASVDSTGRVTIRRNVDMSRYLGWTRGALVFSDTPLREVARDVERTYDVRVTIADSGLAGKLVTASFSNQSVDQVLEEITHVVGAHYERTGPRVVIRQGAVPATHPDLGMRPVLRVTQAGVGP